MKMNQNRSGWWNVVTLVAVVTLALNVTSATATLLYTEAYTGAYTNSTPNTGASGYDFGQKFTVGSRPIEVTSLGVWDFGGNGLLASHEIDLWTAPLAGTPTVIAKSTVSSGVSDPLVVDGSNGFRFATGLLDGAGSPISSLILSANTTYFLTFRQGGGEPFLESVAGYYSTWASGVNPEGATYTTPPSNVDFGTQYAYVGPNLQFDFAPIPEPSTLILLGVGGLLVWRRRSR